MGWGGGGKKIAAAATNSETKIQHGQHGSSSDTSTKILQSYTIDNTFIYMMKTTLILALCLSSTYAFTKEEVKRQVPGACYNHWLGDGTCDSECGDLDQKDCSARFSESRVSVRGKTHGFAIDDATKEAHNTDAYYIAYKASRDSERTEHVLRRGQKFTITIADDDSNGPLVLGNKHYCKFKNKYKGTNCPLEDGQTTTVIVHPFGGTVKDHTGTLSRSGNWWTVGTEKVQGGTATFPTIPATCKLNAVDVKMQIDHTYIEDLKVDLDINGEKHNICNRKCDKNTEKKFQGLNVAVPDTMLISMVDQVKQDQGELLKLSLILHLSGTDCPKATSAGAGLVEGYVIQGHQKSCESVSDNTFECEGISDDVDVGRREISLVRGGEEVESGTVVVLFNPFLKDSPVYMKDPAKRQEYVMEQSGRQYYGNIPWRVRTEDTNQGVGSMSWAYHQFDPDVLDAVLLLLDTAQASYALSDPIWVSRHLTNVLSATTDRNVNGVLHGKWPSADEEDPYKDGKSPTAWTGSRMIFSQWLKDQKTVKYGQCWVFAGILTSALRTIGIPSRSLTTFRSAHDTRYESETNDYDHIIHYQTESESIWNFHVWVDAWMSRADLEAGLLGWNAVDATPQESSSLDREMTMGPAFVPWIKKNKVDHEKMYDAPFVLGEVNAVHRFPNGDDRTDVGRKIVTKLAGTNQRGRWGEHTLNDKYKVCATPFGTVDGESCTDEGTVPETSFEWPEEEDSNRFQETSSGLTKNQATIRNRKSTVGGNGDGSAKVHDTTSRMLMIETGQRGSCPGCFELNVIGDTKVGEDAVVEFKKTSKASGEDWTVHIIVEAVSNNGQPLSKTPLLEKRALGTLTIPVATYISFMDRTLDLKVYAAAVSTSQNKAYFDEIHFEMELPKLTVVPDEANGGVQVNFANPLDSPLTNVELLISESYGDRIEKIGSVHAKQDVSKLVRAADIDECVTVSVICDELFTMPWVQCSCETKKNTPTPAPTPIIPPTSITPPVLSSAPSSDTPPPNPPKLVRQDARHGPLEEP